MFSYKTSTLEETACIAGVAIHRRLVIAQAGTELSQNFATLLGRFATILLVPIWPSCPLANTSFQAAIPKIHMITELK